MGGGVGACFLMWRPWLMKEEAKGKARFRSGSSFVGEKGGKKRGIVVRSWTRPFLRSSFEPVGRLGEEVLTTWDVLV